MGDVTLRLNTALFRRPGMSADSVIKCSDCGSRNIERDYARGEVLCGDCGLIAQERLIDPGAEWVNTEKVERSRVGAPMNLLRVDKGLSTEISGTNRDYAGRVINSKTRTQMYRLKKWNQRAKSHGTKARNLEKAIGELNRLVSVIGLPRSVADRAIAHYRNVLDRRLVAGRTIDSVVAACVYLANQELRTARSLDDVVRNSPATRKQITKAFRLIKQRLKVRVSVAVPEDYLGRYCGLLELPPMVLAECHQIVDRANELEIMHGKSPTGMAAAVVYIASRSTDRLRTQKEISDVSGVTEVTIRNRYKEIVSALGIDLG